jgi:hypothetical protein
LISHRAGGSSENTARKIERRKIPPSHLHPPFFAVPLTLMVCDPLNKRILGFERFVVRPLAL